jgi:hypothetical protein
MRIFCVSSFLACEIIARYHPNEEDKSCQAGVPVIHGFPAGSNSFHNTKVLLFVLLHLLAGLMAGKSHAGDLTFHNNPYFEQHVARTVITDGNIETGAESKTGIEVESNYVDINELRFSPPNCTYHDPELSISPSGVQRAAPGTSIDFTVTVTNTSSNQCGLTNYDLSVIAPPGWDVELDSETLQIASDWSTGVIDMVITSPAQEQGGTYEVKITADNKLLSIEAAATATYVVDSDRDIDLAAPQDNPASDIDDIGENESGIDDAGPISDAGKTIRGVDACIHSEPSLGLAPVAPGRDLKSNLRYSISLTNNDLPACTDSSFDLTITFLPEGWTGSLSARQLILSPGRSGNTILAVTPPATVPAGSYILQVGVLGTRSPEHIKTSMTRHVVNNAESTVSNRSPLKHYGSADGGTHLLINRF